MKDKVVIITGAASGIGRGCAERFSREGARLALVDIDVEKGQALADALSARGDALFVKCDVGLKPEVDRAVAVILTHFSKIDVLVNNAGLNRPAGFLDLSEENFDLVLRTNLKSVFLFGQAVGRHFVARGEGGAIVNMASTSVIMTMPDISAYAASKGGIASLTRAMALYFAPHNVRVNAVGPGTIVTELTRARLVDNPERRRQILGRTPLGRFGQPEDVASVILFLASDDAAYVTGQTIYIDGGRAGLNYTVPVME